MTQRALGQLISRLALGLGTIVFGLGIAEGFVRVLAVMMERSPLLISDVRAGWANRPDIESQAVVVGNSRFVMSTDRNGWRITYPRGWRPAALVPTVVLAGDSFAYGIGVNDEETVAWILARETPYKIVNLGVLGYGTDQELVKLEEFLEANPKERLGAIIVLVFDNDFIDVQQARAPSLGRTKPKFVVHGELIRTAYMPGVSDRLMDISRLFWLLNSKRTALLASENPSPYAGLDVVISCLQSMRRLAEARGAQFHALLHHRVTNNRLRSEPLFDEAVWRRFIERTGAIDITDEILAGDGPDPIGPDAGHWSAAGHRRVASKIEADVLSVPGVR